MKFRGFHNLPFYPTKPNFNSIYRSQSQRRRFFSIFQKLHHTSQARASFNSGTNGSSQGLINHQFSSFSVSFSSILLCMRVYQYIYIDFRAYRRLLCNCVGVVELVLFFSDELVVRVGQSIMSN